MFDSILWLVVSIYVIVFSFLAEALNFLGRMVFLQMEKIWKIVENISFLLEKLDCIQYSLTRKKANNLECYCCNVSFRHFQRSAHVAMFLQQSNHETWSKNVGEVTPDKPFPTCTYESDVSLNEWRILQKATAHPVGVSSIKPLAQQRTHIRTDFVNNLFFFVFKNTANCDSTLVSLRRYRQHQQHNLTASNIATLLEK